jgi:glycerol-3-phosphate dehydrogenase
MTVCIIGAGALGLAVARDLALQGIECAIVERDLAGSGTTGHCAGMLHSGARYAVHTPIISQACAVENRLITELASFAVKQTGALFVSLKSDTPEYRQQFLKGCRQANIPVEEFSKDDALQLESNLSTSVTGAYRTLDNVIDPFSLVDAHVEELEHQGVPVLQYHNFLGATRVGNGWELELSDLRNSRTEKMHTNVVVNASGPWAADIAAAFGVQLRMVYVHGSMVVLDHCPVHHIITRCASNSVGDVLVPFDGYSLVGSTWKVMDHRIPGEIDRDGLRTVLKTSASMVRNISMANVVGTFTGVRSHVSPPSGSRDAPFTLSRDFSIIDHKRRDNVDGLITALSGKLTLYRYVAEMVSNAVLHQIGKQRTISTRDLPLAPPSKPSYRQLGNQGV